MKTEEQRWERLSERRWVEGNLDALERAEYDRLCQSDSDRKAEHGVLSALGGFIADSAVVSEAEMLRVFERTPAAEPARVPHRSR